jgi:beta-xylosidase
MMKNNLSITHLFWFFFLICLACSTDDPLLAELEEENIIENPTEKPTEIENSDNYLSEIKLADPYILSDGDYYYAYGTYDVNKGFHAYKSKDLYTWEHVGLVLEKENTSERAHFWAPEVYKIDNIYYKFFTANRNLYVAKSESPEGPFIQHGRICNNKIDPHLYIENDKKYLFFADASGRACISMGELNDDFISMKEETICECICPQGWEGIINEGPFVYKHGDTYYLTYSGNTYTSQGYGIGVATSHFIMGEWEKSSYNPILQRKEPWVGTGHHSLFVDKNGVNRIVFHAHNDKNSVNPRRMYIGRFHIGKDGVFTVENTFIVPKLKTDVTPIHVFRSSFDDNQPVDGVNRESHQSLQMNKESIR